MIQLTLKAARVNNNLTLVEAARQLNINKDTLSRYEKDSTNIPRLLSLNIQKLYHLPEENLFFGRSDEFHKNISQ